MSVRDFFQKHEKSYQPKTLWRIYGIHITEFCLGTSNFYRAATLHTSPLSLTTQQVPHTLRDVNASVCKSMCVSNGFIHVFNPLGPLHWSVL